MPSRVFAAIDTIVTTITTAGGNVVDGPLVVGDLGDFIYVGYDGDPDGDWLAATIGQEWAGLGNKARDEEFDVVGAVVSRYSADSGRESRNRVQSQFTLVESAIVADPSLGLPPPCVAAVHPVQLFAEEGQYRLTFVIRVKTRV